MARTHYNDSGNSSFSDRLPAKNVYRGTSGYVGFRDSYSGLRIVVYGFVCRGKRKGCKV
jgi:hypothetical protein